MRQAVALKQWLVEQTPPLANEVFLDVDPQAGLQAGVRWKDALRQANARCEAVICLLSQHWEASHECKVEYRTAENLNKQIFVARLQPSTGDDLTSEWQRCDLFGEGPKTAIDIGDGSPVELSTEGLYRLRDGIRGAGIGAESFVWPPPGDLDRAPYRGWEPLDEADAAVFFGRDAQILRALDTLRGMRMAGVNSLFVVLGPSGTGKSSFLRAGLLPRLRREDRRFAVMDIVRPDRNVIVGDGGFAAAIRTSRARYGLAQPSLGEIKTACLDGDVGRVSQWFREIRDVAASRLLQRGDDGDAAAPTLVLPFDQAEELFNAEAAESSEQFLSLLRAVLTDSNSEELGLVVAATIRTDRYEVLQTHPQLAGLGTELFDELKPMPPTQFKEVIVGPAQRAAEGGRALRIAPELVDRLLADAGAGADTLPMLALTLARLYADYGSTGELTLHHYEGMGGMRRVVHTEIDEILSRDTAVRDGQLQALRAAFIPWLATVDPDSGAPMRRVARVADLPVESRELIDALVAKRLMVKDIRDGTPVVEVALESLLRQWDELAGWLRDERKDLRDADDLMRSAEAWRTSGHNSSWLLEGTRLAEATHLVNRPGFQQQLKGIHDYLNASHQREGERRDAEEQRRRAELAAAQEREQAAQERAHHAQEQQAAAERHSATLRKRGHVLRAVIAVTAVVAVVAAFGFVRADAAGNEATRQFREATSQRLTSDALAMLDGSRPGGDIRALQQLSAGQRLAQERNSDAIFDASVATAGLYKLLPIPTQAISIAVSPDGTLVAAGGDGSVWLWDIRSGEMLGDMTGHEGEVGSVVFSRDGALLASGGADSTVRIWDVETRQQKGDVLNVEGSDGVTVKSFNRTGDRIILQGSDGAVWGTEIDGRPGPVRIFPPGVDRFAVSATWDWVATADGDVIEIWDIDAGKQIGSDIVSTHGEVFGLAFSPDGTRLASSGVDNTVRMWDVATATPIGPTMEANSAEVIWLAFAPGGGYLAAAAADGSVRFYDTATQRPMGAPLQALDGFPQGIQITQDGRRMVIGGTDNAVRIYELDIVAPRLGQTSAFSPDGALLATGGRDGVIRLWDRRTGAFTTVGPKIAEITRLEFLPDGRQMLSSDAGGTLQVWDVDAGEPSGPPMSTPGQGILSLAMSEAGDLAVAGYSDGSVRLWDVASRQLAWPAWKAGKGIIPTVGFVEDDTRVAAVALDGTATLYLLDVGNGTKTDEMSIGSDFFMAFGPNDRMVAGRIDGNVTFMTGLDGENIDEAKVTAGHNDAVIAVALSPDGRFAATGARDHSVRIWDAETGSAIGRPLPEGTSMATMLTFSSDGKTLASGSTDDNSTRLWPVSAGVDDLCAKLTANMSHKEWNEWVSPDIDYVQACPDLPVAPD